MCLAIVGALAVASPANAAYSDCPHKVGSNFIIGCLFPDANGGGTPYAMGTNAGCHNLTGGWANYASSVTNNSNYWAASWDYGYRIVLWGNANCSGSSTEIQMGTSTNLPKFLTSIPGNNDAESWAAYPCCGGF